MLYPHGCDYTLFEGMVRGMACSFVIAIAGLFHSGSDLVSF